MTEGSRGSHDTDTLLQYRWNLNVLSLLLCNAFCPYYARQIFMRTISSPFLFYKIHIIQFVRFLFHAEKENYPEIDFDFVLSQILQKSIKLPTLRFLHAAF